MGVLVVESLLAGLLAGMLEVARVRLEGAAVSGATALLVVGLATLGAAVVGPPLLFLGRAAARVPALAAWRLDLRGAARTRAVARAGVAAVALALFAAFAFALAAWTHGRFNAALAVGLLHAVAVSGGAAGLLLLALGADAVVTPRLPVVRLLEGRRGLAFLAAAAALVVLSTLVTVRLLVPAADLRPGLTALGFLSLLALLRLARAGARLRPLPRLGVACAALALAGAALALAGAAPAARRVVVADGIASRAVLSTLWRFADRDGDGHPGALGGADCDDGDAAVHPGARDMPGNGVDENCVGGDAPKRDRAPAPSPWPDAPRHNVLLISIDAVRADHVGAWGYARPTTPNLDAFAAGATRFEWAITPSPTTRRAIPALVTGRYASALAFRPGAVWPPELVPKKHTLIGEVFKAGGYETRAILCCTGLFDKRAGVVAGLDKVDATAAKDYRRTYRNSDKIAKNINDFLRSRPAGARPFFLWTHFIDPHDPYQRMPGAPDFGGAPMDLYDGEIAYVDQQLASVFATLRAAGLEDRTVVAITADHGDEFLEHGHRFHGRSLYNELVRVPLLVRYPGAAPRVVAEPVSLIDVAPTLVHLVGLAAPASFTGVSHAGTVRDGAPMPDRTVLAELIRDRNITRELRAAFHGGWKLIWDLEADAYELYSLADDPGDRSPRDDPDRLADLKRRLHESLERELVPP